VNARDTSFRLVVKSLIAAALIVLLVLALLRLLDLWILVFGAVVAATLVRGLADAIERRTPLNGKGSLSVAVLLVIALFAGFGWLFGSQLQTDLGAVARTLRESWDGLRVVIAAYPGGKDVAAAMQTARVPTDNFVPRLVGALSWLTTAAIDLVVVLFGIVFIAADPGLYRRGLALMFPRKHRPLAEEALIDAGLALRQWTVGLFVVMVFIGVFCGLGLWLVGVPSAAGLGLIAGLFELIPYLGPIISMVPVALVAATKGPETLWLSMAVMLVVHWVEAAFVAPLAAQRTVSLPPAVSVFGVIAGGMLFGPVGLVFASPLLVVALVLVKRLWVEEALHTPTHVPGRDPEPG
jgi:predicted PurR-regulated permease PerM